MKAEALLAPALAVALSTLGCGPDVKAPDSENAIVGIHRARCGACHVRVEPGTRAREYLVGALARHRNRVRLTEAEWAQMVDYLAR